MIDPTFRYASQPCPQCGAAQDAARDPDDPWAQPRDGAIMMCFYCARPNVWVEATSQMRIPTPEEQADLDADDHVATMRAAILSVPMRRPRRA